MNLIDLFNESTKIKKNVTDLINVNENENQCNRHCNLWRIANLLAFITKIKPIKQLIANSRSN
jgi:hypothetical protein